MNRRQPHIQTNSNTNRTQETQTNEEAVEVYCIAPLTQIILVILTQSFSLPMFGSFVFVETADGTGVSPLLKKPEFNPKEGIDNGYSNILKLVVLAGGSFNNKKNDVPDQICLYESGIAAMSDSKIINTINKIHGDLSQQTVPMRKMLEEVYEEGDKLYIIGFSRGASSARKFVTELAEHGIHTASNPNKKVENPPIEFLGCFDTVSMQVQDNLLDILKTKFTREMTKSSVLGEIDGKLPGIVKKAVHNLSLDDRRFHGLLKNLFPPVLMDSADDRVHEVWFPGVHSDVGGNFFHHGISDCSGKYMQEWMESLEDGITFIQPKDILPECLQIDGHTDIHITPEDVTLNPNAADTLHPQEKDGGSRPVVTVTNEKIVEGGIVRIHVSVLHHMEAMKKKNTPYAINPNIRETNLVVVGSLNKVLEEETKRFKELLEL